MRLAISLGVVINRRMNANVGYAKHLLITNGYSCDVNAIGRENFSNRGILIDGRNADLSSQLLSVQNRGRKPVGTAKKQGSVPYISA